MTFLHNNCNFELMNLKYFDEKSRFEKVWEFSWKIKPISLQDNSFSLTEVKWETFKITYFWDLDLIWNERINITFWKFAWKYSVKEFRKHLGLYLQTTKILIVKIW